VDVSLTASQCTDTSYGDKATSLLIASKVSFASFWVAFTLPDQTLPPAFD
jgi:hypothetical protein